MERINKKGEDGCINVEGKVGAGAYMFDINDPVFWDNIEDGIKPLVEVFLKHKLITANSCQGHYKKNTDEFARVGTTQNANVRYLTDHPLAKSVRRSVYRYKNKQVYWEDCSSISEPGKITERVAFNICPKDEEARKYLNEEIIRFAKFLDDNLTKETQK